MTEITYDNLYPCFNAGTPNNKQLAMFGMSWPLHHGWAKEMIGRQVSEDFLPKLMALKKTRNAHASHNKDATNPDELSRLRTFAQYVRDHSRAGLESGGNIYLQLNLIKSAAMEIISSDKRQPSSP